MWGIEGEKVEGTTEYEDSCYMFGIDIDVYEYAYIKAIFWHNEMTKSLISSF